MVKTQDLSFAYTQGPGWQFPDFELEAGEGLCLLGPSGCGKTTLLHLLAGILQPHGGTVLIAGQAIHALAEARRDRFRGKYIGLVYQRPHLIKALNVEQNLALAQRLAGLPKDAARISEVLESLNMGHKRKAPVTRLSQGEAQRVTFARAVLNNPSLLLADEPTASLDDANAEAVMQLLQQMAQQHKAALLVTTHDARVRAHFTQTITLSPATA